MPIRSDRSSLRTVVALAAAVWACCLAVPFAACAQGGPLVQGFRLEIEPHGQADEEALRDLITSVQVGEPYNAAKADAALGALLETGSFRRGHEQSYVEAERANDGVVLVFHLTENPLLSRITIEGNTAIGTGELADALLEILPAEQVINEAALPGLIEESIGRLYAERGYRVILLPHKLEDDGRLLVSVVEQYVEDIRFEGLEDTKRKVVEREVETTPGRLVNVFLIQKDLQRLSRLRIFDNVEVSGWISGEQAGAVIPVFTFEEAETGSITAGGSFDTRRGLLGYAEYDERNLGGNAQRLRIAAEFGSFYTLDASFLDPSIGPNHSSLHIQAFGSLYNSGRLALGGAGQSFAAETTYGGQIEFRRPLDDDRERTIAVGYRNQFRRSFDARLTNVLPPASLRGRVGSFKVTFASDARDIPENPRRGGYHTVSLEQAARWLGGQSTFTKIEADLRQYLSLGSRGVFALRAAAGSTVGSLPPVFESFRLGGADSLRGYAEDRWWGTNRVLLSAEYRHQIIGHSPDRGAQIVFFGDYGSAFGGVWRGTDGSSLFSENQAFAGRLGYGVGLRVYTSLGPMRLDYGMGNEGGRVHFGIFQTF